MEKIFIIFLCGVLLLLFSAIAVDFSQMDEKAAYVTPCVESGKRVEDCRYLYWAKKQKELHNDKRS